MQERHRGEYRYSCCYLEGNKEDRRFAYFETDNLQEAHRYLKLDGWPTIPEGRNPNVLHGRNYETNDRVLLDADLFMQGKNSIIARSTRKRKLFGIF